MVKEATCGMSKDKEKEITSENNLYLTSLVNRSLKNVNSLCPYWIVALSQAQNFR